MSTNEVISCFRTVRAFCAIPLTPIEREIVTTQLESISSAIRDMLTGWSDVDRSEKAALHLVNPYRALVELLAPHVSETALHTLSVPVAIKPDEFSSAACGRGAANREELKRQWEDTLRITTPLLHPVR